MRSDTPSFTERHRRRQLCEAAIRVLARDGFGAASLAGVAREAGVSKGVVPYHFGTKEELLAAVVGHVNGDAEAFMVTRLVGARSATESLRTYIEANLAFFAAHRDEVVALVEVVTHAPAPDPYAPLRHEALSALGELIAAGQAAGEFRSCDPDLFAAAVRGAIDSLAARLRGEPGLDLPRAGRELGELFVRAAAP